VSADPLLAGKLRSRGFSGEIVAPGDAVYDDARRIHNGLIDKRPRLIARCGSAADAAAAIALAVEEGLEISIRGGGHNVAGRSVTEGGVMIDLSPLRGVSVRPAERKAVVQGGATWGDLDRASQLHGLAVTGGMISTTGVAGLTLGGGLGWLMGAYGLTVDSLLAAEVVTADGRIFETSDEEHADLFWALRGGGGNFGVVTSFTFRLHRVGPVVTAFRAAYPLSEAGTVLRAYRDATAGAHDDLTLNAGLLHAADGSGTKLAGIVGCHLGPARQAERDLERLRRLGPPVDGYLGPLDYVAVNSLLDAAYPRGALNYWKSSFLEELSDEAIDAMVGLFADCPSPMTAFVLENLHGAVTCVPVPATAVPLREPGYNFLVTSVWRERDATEKNIAWTRTVYSELERFLARRRYVNYIADDEIGDDPVREAYGPNYERLVAVKTAYDPANVFRLNQNIVPAGGSRADARRVTGRRL
jgi:FAD/FMN-containing dehydrogenase